MYPPHLPLPGKVKIEIWKIPHHESRAPSGGVVELQAGGDAVDDVLGPAEAPEPQVD